MLLRDGAAPRVRMGARFLDIVRPTWPRDIDLETLDMSRIDHSVLAQLHGSMMNPYTLWINLYADALHKAAMRRARRVSPHGEVRVRREHLLWFGVTMANSRLFRLGFDAPTDRELKALRDTRGTRSELDTEAAYYALLTHLWRTEVLRRREGTM